MKRKDRELGMHCSITRRDFLHGVGALSALPLLSGCAGPEPALLLERSATAYYPPGLTGLRGGHVGSFEVAHQLAREGRRDWGAVSEEDEHIYDLVVVGAGLSGLAAAHFYRKEHPDARILLLDNHDDFGGHAKRNEFEVGGRTIIGYGGSQSLEDPGSYSRSTKSLLGDIGVNTKSFKKAFDHNFYRRHKLAAAVFFDKENWDVNRLVKYDLGSLRFVMPLAESPESIDEAVAKMPMSEAARAQMLRLLTSHDDAFPGLTKQQRREILESISYRDYLKDYLGVSEPQVFEALQRLTTDLGADAGAVTANGAINYIGLPGFEASGLNEDESEPYIFHFPDGNASVARLLVRHMIPDVMPGSSMEDSVGALFDYSKLDMEDSSVRLRLSSTVVNVQHESPGSASSNLTVDYVRNGKRAQVRAKACVMACYNAIIPAICPELPERQREALSNGVKIPIFYTNVALNNWHAWKKAGVGAISAPGSYHVNAMLDFPVDMGGYKFSKEPDQPVIVHMERFPHRPGEDLNLREHSRLGRLEMLSTSFETIERNTREQLAAMLASGDFDPARDIAGITVNRWPHGYGTRDWLEDDWYEDPYDDRYWFVRGRQKFGRIVIANSDAGASATIDSAVRQAHRAIGELG